MSIKWKCTSCGMTAPAHPSTEPGSTQGCVGGSCGGEMICGSPKPKRSGPPKLKRTKAIPGRCPICLGMDCGDPACLKYREDVA